MSGTVRGSFPHSRDCPRRSRKEHERGMGDFRRGDFVVVLPTEPEAPREVRGLAGVVKNIRDGRATVEWRSDENAFVYDIEAHLLRPERRRRGRPPAHWSGDELAAAS